MRTEPDRPQDEASEPGTDAADGDFVVEPDADGAADSGLDSAASAGDGGGFDSAASAASESSESSAASTRADFGAAVMARPTDARLARLHIRAGLSSLARAELEALAGLASLDDGTPLDTDTLLDLAEVRWRTGDLAGAGEAAFAYLDVGGTSALGYVIAAEATSGLGRPGEARRLAGHALERMDTPIDALFAGIPRSSVWPTDPADPGEPVAPLFPAAGQSALRPARSRPTRAIVSGSASRGVDRAADVSPGPASAIDDGGVRTLPAVGAPNANSTPSTSLGLWDATDAQAAGGSRPLDANGELAAAREALAAGRMDEAAVRLAVALRIGPSLAPAVLDAAAGAAGPSFELVRGDAYRLVGHEIEARRAYAAAAMSATSAAERFARRPPGVTSSVADEGDSPGEEGKSRSSTEASDVVGDG